MIELDVSRSLDGTLYVFHGGCERAHLGLCRPLTDLTDAEIEYLPFSSKLMTLECGMRFLGDYLNGDTYFRIDYPEHNLVRARTQFKLVEDMEKQMAEMKKVTQEIYEKVCK